MMLAAAAAILPFGIGGAAMADPGDGWREQWKIRAECDEKLAKADSRREFYKEAAECNKKLAKWDREQRKEAAKSWREAEKKWHERRREQIERYYDWDD